MIAAMMPITRFRPSSIGKAFYAFAFCSSIRSCDRPVADEMTPVTKYGGSTSPTERRGLE
jgi:hypothetical protein